MKQLSYLQQQQHEFFLSGKTRKLSFRQEALKKLSECVIRRKTEILDALHTDLNKSATEGEMTEISVLQEEIRYVSKHLRKWSKPLNVKTPLVLFPARSYRIAEPYGVVLIMSPWNYPLLLSLEPLVGAIAAGNCAVIKPSAYSPATSSIIARIIAECFPPEYCTVVEGGREENSGLLALPFDYIFFTGSTTVGKKVMEAASANLIPVSLELGGKSPVIIHKSADVDLAAKRIVFGKFINAGQTCVAPDYILVPASLRDRLQERLCHWINTFYPADEQGIIENYPRMVNEKHFDRVLGLLNNQKILFGGKSIRQTLTINPTVLTDVFPDSGVMQEEIFGPVLPILTYITLNEAIEFVRSRPKPLALYLFTKDKKAREKVLRELSYGGGCVNDTLVHVASSYLPFGGVGYSGMGSYHGKASFDTFTHYKSILDKGAHLDPSLRYRPYTPGKIRWLKKLFF
ncbi:MAG TPA: aldehyde dehydrogenase [Bacteroidales bacterium]|nr:aldehyde dehydrogenase [Bacteroidales bacterium]HPJ55438.1 aldehyde dehydrogenase [Bacteroidales bacterium]